jgi:transposase
MRHRKNSSELGFTADDITFLTELLRTTHNVHVFQRVQAVLLVAQGKHPDEAAAITTLSRRSVYRWIDFYRAAHQQTLFEDIPRPGRPVTAPDITADRLEALLHTDPQSYGYRATGWTVALLRQHCEHHFGAVIGDDALRARLHQLGWRWKRPRYVFAEPDAHRAQKKGGSYAHFLGYIPISRRQ